MPGRPPGRELRTKAPSRRIVLIRVAQSWPRPRVAPGHGKCELRLRASRRKPAARRNFRVLVNQWRLHLQGSADGARRLCRQAHACCPEALAWQAARDGAVRGFHASDCTRSPSAAKVGIYGSCRPNSTKISVPPEP